jgi:hypothetical protein
MQAVAPPGVATRSPEFFAACAADVNMMAWTGGKQRTAEEFRELLKAAGFGLTRIVPTSTPLSLIEARSD